MQAYDSRARALRLGRHLGRGGEGSVYEVLDRVGLVAKVYHQPPNREQTGKLRVLVAEQDAAVLQIAAWPVELIAAHPNGPPTGFLMPKLDGFKDVHLLYGPKSRLTAFPSANYRFLVHAATNLARAFVVAHTHRAVVGDVNHANVVVSQQATVKFIDCDSFQVCDRTTGEVYHCHVGVPTHQPPELLARGSFDGIVRTPNHDSFGLAVLIFQLLFLGRHPFAGTYLDGGDMPIERAIREHRFAYGKAASSLRMRPPPGLPPLQGFAPVAPLFEQAFAAGAETGCGRPSAEDWVRALEQLQQQLRPCSQNAAHAAPLGIGCLVCDLERATGAVFFFVPAAATRAATGPFNLTLVWGHIMAAPSPGPAPVLPQPQSLGLESSSEARLEGFARRARVSFAVSLILVGLVGWTTGVPLSGAAAFWNFAGAALVAWIVVQKASKTGLAAYKAAAASARTEWKTIVERWQAEAGDRAFSQKRAELERARNEYLDLDSLRQRKLDQLKTQLEQRQRQKFLDRHRIAHADIPGIGQVRVAALLSYGIETAADIAPHKVLQVPGFGPGLTDSLVAWRRTVERGFRFDPRQGVDPLDIAQVDGEFATKRARLEQTLRNGATELERLRQHAIQQRQALQTQVDQALARVAQVEADLKVA